MDQYSNYGLLINPDIKLHRMWFKQMTKLHGINCIYKAPKNSKNFDVHGELETNEYPGVVVGCIFQDHPDQKSLKKMGWVTELQEGSSIIHVPYDLENLEVGAHFIVPSGIDNAVGRVFRVISMSNIMIYPASIACEIAPEYETSETNNTVNSFVNNNFTLLKDNEDDD